ncbi:MAG: metallophosphoesterase family protein [Microcoleaceae cyanobacterium]
MNLKCRFAIASDLHIALPHTIRNSAQRFHLVEVSIPALELVLEHLGQLDLDFLLLPGDLTQDGEVENHTWLVNRLAQLPYPVYVVPGNHDVLYPTTQDQTLGLAEFPSNYQKFGYDNPNQACYTHEVLPGLRLIGLNSNLFDQTGQQIGRLDAEQLAWLQQVLARVNGELVMVMIHHNVVEHLPGQATNPLGKRYMLQNAPDLLKILQVANVKLIFTGHLHVQDIAQWQGIYDITTGSLVSYPHPYRIVNLRTEDDGSIRLEIESHHVKAVPNWPNLPDMSRQWMGDRSFPFMVKLLTTPPLSLSIAQAEKLAPSLSNFWADIAAGDAEFDFPDLPPNVQDYFQGFSAQQKIDNNATLVLEKD